MDMQLVFTVEELAMLISALDNHATNQEGIYKEKVEKLQIYIEAKLKTAVKK